LRETPALSDYCFWAPYKYSATTTTGTITTTTKYYINHDTPADSTKNVTA